MLLYIVRHAQTYWNKLQKFQGQVNIPLNDTGLKQSRVLAKALTGLDYDHVYSSPLNRCYKMAEMIYGHETEIIKEPLIKEIAFGIYEGESYSDISIYGPEHPFYNFFHKPEEYIPPAGGESFIDLHRRTDEFLEKLVDEHKKDKILAFSHGAFIRSLLNNIKLKNGERNISMMTPNNCSVTIIRRQDNKFVIEQEAIDILNGEKIIL